MRICFFKPNSLTEWGGTEIWMVEVSRRLSEHHEVGIVGLKHVEVRRISPSRLKPLLNHVNYYEFPSVKPPVGFALPNPLYISQLLNIFNSYDLVYVIVPSGPIEILLYLLKLKIRSSLIAGFHSILRPEVLLHKLYSPLFNKTLSIFNFYHVLNRSIYLYLKKLGFSNVFHIPNGVDTATFQLSPMLSTDSFNILFSGRLRESKGTDILVEIISYINEKLKIPDIKFIIAGSGPLEEVIKRLARKYRNVHYLGFITPKALPNIYRNAHLFLIPSKMEGMPLSLLEAQSCGLPAVGSNVPGVSDVIVNGRTGRLIYPGDVEGYANAIKDYYELWRSSPNRYRELSRYVREYIVNNYDWNTIVSKLEKMFKETIYGRVN